MNSLPPLDWLRTFESAARLQSFSAAADELHLTQAGVSQQIRKLEARLGVVLFKRLPRSVEVTAQGDAFLPYVRKALETLMRGTGDLFYAKHIRQITIAAPASFNALWLTPRLIAIRQALPDVNVSIFSIHRYADYDTIDADIEIRFGSGGWVGETQQLLFEEVLSPVCSTMLAKSIVQDHWQTLPKLSLTGPRSGWASWCELTGDTELIQPTLRFDSLLTALEAVKTDAGVLLASIPLVKPRINSGELVRLSTIELTENNGYWLVRKPDRRIDPSVDDISEFICNKDANT